MASSVKRVADPEIGLNIDRVVLFERDMNGNERARNDGRTALVEGQTGPPTPFREPAGDDDAARGDLDDLRPGPDMGTHPGVDRQPVLAPARAILGERRLRLALLGGRPQRCPQLEIAEPADIAAHGREHRPRDSLSGEPRRDHDLQRADRIGPARLDMVLVRPADHRVPAAIRQVRAARHIAKRERHAKRARHWPIRLVEIDRDQPVLEIAGQRGVRVVEGGGRVMPDKFRHRGLDFRAKYLVAQVRPLGEGGDDQPLGHRRPRHLLSLPAMIALILLRSSRGCSMPERSTWSNMPTRLSRWPQPLVIASVNSSRARLARRIGTPTSLPSPTASDTSLCRRRSAKSAGSYCPARNLPSRSNVRGRPVAPWRTASHKSSGATPALIPIVKTSASATFMTALVQLCTSLAIVPAPIGPI